MQSKRRTIKSIASAPNRYPATEEKTTLTDNLTLVISTKFLMKDCGTDVDWVTDKLNNFYLLRVKKCPV